LITNVNPYYQPLAACRVCGGDRLTSYLDLGSLPLANSLRDPADATPELRAPLNVLFCHECALSQLSVVVSPEHMFRHYLYRSGVSDTFRNHCRKFAAEAAALVPLKPGNVVVDVGCNDGTLASTFLAHGQRVFGVDPALNLASLAHAAGIETISDFWGAAAAETLLARAGKASLITATNVLAHVHDLNAFFHALNIALDDNGLAAFEVPYLCDLIEKNEFDTIYHEHLSYFLLKPIIRLAERHGLHVAYVRRIPIHGGGLRVYLGRSSGVTAPVQTVKAVLAFEEEAGMYELPTYRHFVRQVQSTCRDLREALLRLRAQGSRIAAYGASAKGATLLNSIALTPGTIDYIVDDTPGKQGMLSPGMGIPIVDGARLSQDPPDYLLILAWNFVEEIIGKTGDFSRRGGQYVVPVPALRFIQ
jgi:novobiocin biosynthesis protein NovU/D-mycarose 3-C-methyltransferase